MGEGSVQQVMGANGSASDWKGIMSISGVISWVVVSALTASCGQAVGMGEARDASPTPDAVPLEPPQWAMRGATPQRNGRSAYIGPEQGRYEKWELAGEDDLVIVDAVGPDGAVYVVIRRDGNQVGQLVAIAPDGELRWLLPESDHFALGGIALTNSGRLLFEGAQLLEGSDPMNPEYNVFFDLDVSGALRWAWQPPEPPALLPGSRYSAPWYDDTGNSYILLPHRRPSDYGAGEGYLYSFGPEGQLRWRWERNVGGPFSVPPPAMAPSGTIYVAVKQGRGEPPDPEGGLYALSQDGSEQWFVHFGYFDFFHALAAGDDGTAYVVAGTAGIDATMLTAIGPDGDTDWTFSVTQAGFRAVTTSIGVSPDGTLYLGASHDRPWSPPNGGVIALSPEGSVVWSIDTDLVPSGGLAVDAAGAVYVATQSPDIDSIGTSRPSILAISPDGALRQAYELEEEYLPWLARPAMPNRSLSVVLAADGRIYRGSHQGLLHIIQPSSP